MRFLLLRGHGPEECPYGGVVLRGPMETARANTLLRVAASWRVHVCVLEALRHTPLSLLNTAIQYRARANILSLTDKIATLERCIIHLIYEYATQTREHPM